MIRYGVGHGLSVSFPATRLPLSWNYLRLDRSWTPYFLVLFPVFSLPPARVVVHLLFARICSERFRILEIVIERDVLAVMVYPQLNFICYCNLQNAGLLLCKG